MNIKYGLLALICCLFAVPGHADLPVWQDNATDIESARITAQVGEGENNPSWPLTTVETDVLLTKLAAELPEKKHPNTDLFAQAPWPEPAYTGLRLDATLYDGRELPPLIIIGGQIRSLNDVPLKKDPGRELEIWLFGTGKKVRHKLLATQVMPIFTFRQCVNLGAPIIETNPRQCLLPNNNIILDVPERATQTDLQINNFKDCLKDGVALIDAFPRRCLARGGRVFTEPPKVYDTNAFEPMGTPDATGTESTSK